MIKSIDDLLYMIEYTNNIMKPKFLDDAIDCIKDLRQERAELREIVEQGLGYDAWILISNKYGWE